MDILGGKKPFNQEILKAYMDTFNFKGLELIEAMRIFFGNLLMFGDS